jgi:hypothetical protein
VGCRIRYTGSAVLACLMYLYVKAYINNNNILTRKNCFRYLKLMSPLNAAICTTISYTLWVEWYYIKTIIWPWGQRSRSHEGHYGTRHTVLWSCTHILNIIDLSRDKNVMARIRKYYLKNKSRSNAGHYGTRHTALWLVFSCPGHNIFVFRDRSMIIGMWVHDHKAVCRIL